MTEVVVTTEDQTRRDGRVPVLVSATALGAHLGCTRQYIARLAPSLPSKVTDPFKVLSGKIGNELEQTIRNAKRDGVNVVERPQGSQRAGSIEPASPGYFLEVTVATKPPTTPQLVPRRYELLLNSNLSRESRYATLVHELGHLASDPPRRTGDC